MNRDQFGLKMKARLLVASDGTLISSSVHVLLVDDVAVDREVGKRVLENMGYAVSTASGGSEAVHTLSLYPDINLVLMDIHMPEKDGVSSAKAVRNIPCHLDTPIIAVTHDESDDTCKKAMAAGMNGYILKPLKRESLETAILAIQGHHHEAASIQ